MNTQLNILTSAILADLKDKGLITPDEERTITKKVLMNDETLALNESPAENGDNSTNVA